MTNPCSPNSSEPKDGLAAILVFDAAKLAQFLLQMGMGWLSPLVPEIGGKSYNLADFCAADPPDRPEDDPSAIAEFFDPLNPNGAQQQRDWLADLVNYNVWYASCQCSAGSQPATPDPIDQPPDVDFQPPNTTSSDHCFEGNSSHTPNYANGVAWNFNDALPSGTGFSDGQFNIPPIPSPLPSSIVISASVGNDGARPAGVQFVINFYTPSHSSISSASFVAGTVTAGSSYTSPTVPIPSNAAFWAIIATVTVGGDPTATNTIDLTATVYCQGQGPNSLGMVCCPTDPNLLAMIQQLLDQVLFIESIIPVRAQTYVTRDTTSGLSGTGTYDVADSSVIALKIVITSLPSVYSVVDGFPDTYLGVGWITPTNAGGPEAGMRLSRTTQVIALPEATTGLDYALEPGEVISITELLSG